MRKNLTPNPFPRGKGDQIEREFFLSGKEQRIRKSPFANWKGNSRERISAVLRAIAVGAIAIYRSVVSPVIHAINGPACRFEPSCSEYARGAIAEHGVVRGGAMAIWRIARCNPMGGHGYDPVRGRSGSRSFSIGILNRARRVPRAEQGPSPSSSPLQGEGKTARSLGAS